MLFINIEEMVCGIIDLVCKNEEDSYLLSTDPVFSMFIEVHKPHTLFSIESREQYFENNKVKQISFGSTAECVLDKKGDLIYRTMIYVKLPEISNEYKVAWVKNIGFALIDSVSVYVGDDLLDKQYGEWLYIWSQLSTKKMDALDKMVGNISELTEFTFGKQSYDLYIPLQFWFCKASGLSLPICALDNNVKISVTFRPLESVLRLASTHSIRLALPLNPFNGYIFQKNGAMGYVTDFDYLTKTLYYVKINTIPFGIEILENNISVYNMNALLSKKSETIHDLNNPDISSVIISDEKEEYINYPDGLKLHSYLYVDYVIVGNIERQHLKTEPLEYVIEQLQFQSVPGLTSRSAKINLSVSKPIKTVYWVLQQSEKHDVNNIFNYTNSPDEKVGTNLMDDAKFTISNIDLTEKQTSMYYNLIEPYEHFNRGPATGIYTYSLSMYPNNRQSSGSYDLSGCILTMSLDKTVSNTDPVNFRLYATNYNVYKITNGVGKLQF